MFKRVCRWLQREDNDEMKGCSHYAFAHAGCDAVGACDVDIDVVVGMDVVGAHAPSAWMLTLSAWMWMSTWVMMT